MKYERQNVTKDMKANEDIIMKRRKKWPEGWGRREKKRKWKRKLNSKVLAFSLCISFSFHGLINYNN